MIRVNKQKARRLFNEGKDVLVYPALANLNSPWIHPCEINKYMTHTFDEIVTEFEFYQCNAEMGYYAKFYVERGEQDD